MNESVARDVLLVRAIESADSERVLLSEDDRRYASRVAAELARWQAAEHGAAASAELFVGKRAELLTGKLNERHPALARMMGEAEWRSWIGVFAPLVALLLGVFVEHVTDRHHVNVLAFPLLGLIVWNIAVYAFVAARSTVRASGGRVSHGALRNWIAGLAGRSLSASGGPAAPLRTALATFSADWLTRSAALSSLRAARVLHLAAALFALGAVAGLYVRGLAFEYRAGWESTFLDAPAVHGLLAFFLAPAAKLTGVPFPSIQELAAIRWSVNAQGENAAPWIHLYTATVALTVIVPRFVMFLVTSWLERRRAQRFPIDLNEPYFRRVLAGLGTGRAKVRVVPYSYTPDEAAIAGLLAIARRLLGEDAELITRPTVTFGGEEEAAAGIGPLDSEVVLTLALVNLAATPEVENHGIFFQKLAQVAPAGLAAIADESGFRRRLGTQAAETDRLAERRELWRTFAAAHGVPLLAIDLSAPDLPAAERTLERALSDGVRR